MQYGVHNLQARVGIFGQNERRVKNNEPYLEGQVVGGRQLVISC